MPRCEEEGCKKIGKKDKELDVFLCDEHRLTDKDRKEYRDALKALDNLNNKDYWKCVGKCNGMNLLVPK